eukprot:TRINITY_DN9048_c0_g3_i1.p2 TRINITY_DN9048_c0_g3~~TRINITY_DN9048_c0_g3_i1.p2  ORF type:complete len:188 (-),score=65.95 TRINITY_DN9048_c0_g3_i1:89-652(-)
MYPRPGTQAAKMKRVPTQEVKRRSRECTKLFESYQTFDNLVGQTMRVWFSGEMATDKVNLVGHTKNYVQVLVPPDQAKFGVSAMCKITKSAKFCVFGQVVGDLIYPTMPEGGSVMTSAKKGKVTIKKRKKQPQEEEEMVQEKEQVESGNKTNKNGNKNGSGMDLKMLWMVVLVVLVAFALMNYGNNH